MNNLPPRNTVATESKDTISRANGKEKPLRPLFRPLKENPKTFKDHVDNLTSANVVPHKQLLEEMLAAIHPVDFEELAFPWIKKDKERIEKLKTEVQNEDGSFKNDDKAKDKKEEIKRLVAKLDKIKVTQKHYIVIAIQEILSLAHKSKWALCVKYGNVYIFNGAYWKPCPSDDFTTFLGQAAEKMGLSSIDASYHRVRDELYRQFLAAANLPTPEPQTGQVLINLLNGTFVFTPNKQYLKKPDARDFLTYQLPFSYNPDAVAPTFKKYLVEVLPDENLKKILFEYLGYVFVDPATLKLEKALMLVGDGSNGKSVMFDIAFALLGKENVISHSISSLTDATRANYRADLANKLLNYCTEFNNIKDKALFKAIVSCENISARLLYQQAFNFVNKCKLIFNANEYPSEVEHTHAFFRRFLLIPFDVTIPAEKQDKHLAQRIIKDELSGVFNLVLEGLQRLIKQQGFTHSDKVDKALKDFKEQSDSVQMFINEKGYLPTEFGEAYKYLADLYNQYRIYCNDDGYKPTGKKKFKQRLERIGFTSHRMNTGVIIYCKEENYEENKSF